MGKILRPTRPPSLRWIGNNAALHSGILNDPLWANVKLLLHCDGVAGGVTFTDSTGRHTCTPQGTPQGPTTETGTVYAGTASGVNDQTGTGKYLNITGNLSDFSFGTGDFCIELWVYGRLDPAAGKLSSIFSTAKFAAGGAYGMVLACVSWSPGTTGAFQVFETAGVGVCYWNPGNEVAGQWNHVALTRISGVYALYYNGVALTKVGGGVENRSYTYTTNVRALCLYADTTVVGNLFNGIFDELRITVGNGRYTGNFTPPSGPFPNQ